MVAARYVLIGGSAASVATLKALLASREDHRVVVLCAEAYPPYTPTSLHHVLASHVREEDIFMTPPPLLADARLEVALGNPAVAIRPEAKRVECADGRTYPYDKLLIGAGARASLPPIPGREHENVLVFRTLD
ncbi:MAG: FAD-dependent oxidoreductase, partial [Nitrospinota bacterium]